MTTGATRRWICVVAAGGLIAAAAGRGEAALIPNTTPIPDDLVLIDFDGTGLDWVYAGPVMPGNGGMETPDFRAGEGWRFATEAEWTLRPQWTDFVISVVGGGYPTDYGDDHGSYRYASEYWSDYKYVDVTNAAEGALSNGLILVAGAETISDVWYVRTTRSNVAVPEPSALALAGVGALASLAFAGRRARPGRGDS